MANYIEDELEDLKKQFAFLSKSILPEIQNLSQQITASSAQFETFNSQISNLNEQIDGVSSQVSSIENSVATVENSVATLENTFTALENSVGTLESNVATIENSVDTIESAVGALENTVDTLESTVNNLVDNPPSGGGSEENWVTIYDFHSEDTSLNWGRTTPLISGTVVENAPNFRLYKKLKLTYFAGEAYDQFVNTYDCSNLATNIVENYKLVGPQALASYKLISSSMTLRIMDDDSINLAVMTCYVISILNNKYPTLTSKSSDTTWGYTKIEGLPF